MLYIFFIIYSLQISYIYVSSHYEKHVQTIPSAPTESAVGPCPTLTQLVYTTRHGSTTVTRAFILRL